MRFIGFVVGLGFASFFLWMFVAQPMITPSSVSGGVAISAEQLKTHVEIIAGSLSPRDVDHPVQLNGVANYIMGQFQMAGGEISEQVYHLSGGRGPYRNVIVSFGPRTGSRIVVGAHYD